MYDKELEDCQVSTLNFQNESKFDPDVNLSYIDDRIQSLLGHLVKDFDGCKEDLGAKYGGYGSFLPNVYEHSPPSVSSCSRKTQAVQNSNTLRHQNEPHAVQNSKVLRHQNNMSQTKLRQDTTVNTSRKRGHDPRNPALLPVANASSLRTSSKEDVGLSSMQGTVGLAAECVASDSLINPPEKKSGKVQKKRGRVPTLPTKNLQVYRELGLDSPSSSSSDISLQNEEAPDDSPTTIPMDTSSSPTLEKCSLSLSPDRLLGKELISDESLITILENMTSSPIKGESFLSPLPDSVLCLMEKPRGEVCGLNTAALSPQGNWLSMAFSDASKIEKRKSNPEEKIRGDRRENSHRGFQSEKRTDESITSGSRITASGGKSTNLLKKIVQRAIPAQQGGSMNPQRKEQPQSGDKKKSNRSQCQIKVATAGKSTIESARVESTTSLKPKATSGDFLPKRKVGGSDCLKKSGKSKDFNDNSFSHSNQFEKRSDLDLPKGSKRSVGEKENQIFTKKATKSSGEMFDSSLTSMRENVAAPAFAPIPGKDPISDTVHLTTNPVPNDEWVGCDLCEQWRLLPCGTSAKDLQNKEWQCSMLYWLPGMNHCSVSEDVTTQAVRALSQLPAPGRHPDSLFQSHENHNLASPAPGKKKENCYDVKSSVKRLVDQDGLRISKKRKSEAFYSAKEENLMGKGGIGRTLGSDPHNAFLIEKNEKECRAKTSSNDSISNQKDRVPATVMKKPRDRDNTCNNGSDVDMGISSNTIVKKRKAELHSGSGRSFRDDREETDKGAENRGFTVKTICGSRNGLDGQKYEPHPSSTGVKPDQKPNISCLINNPRDLVEVSSNGHGKKTENIDNAKVVPGKRKEEGKVISFSDKLKASNDCKGKLTSGLSDDHCVEKGGLKCSGYSSSNESKLDQDKVSAPVKNSRCRIKISFKGKSYDNLKALEQKNKVEVTPSSSVCSIQESKQRTSEAVIGKAVSEPKILPVSGKPKIQTQFDTGNNLKAPEEKNNVEVTPSSSVCSIRESKQGTSEAVIGKAVSEPKILSASGKPKIQTQFDTGNNLKALEEKNNVVVTPSSSVCSIRESKQGTSEAVIGKVVSEPNILPASGKPKLQTQFDTGNKQIRPSHCSTKRNMNNDNVTRSVEKDLPSQMTANKVIKEGNDLKDKADRLKVFGSELDSTYLSFQAALKFFRGAFLLESCNNQIAKNPDTSHSIYMYRRTAELCRSVAQEYEKSKENAAASLAYKCMEVAYMRIIYSRNSRINQDRNALQIALPDARLGESPSSSISDVDNLTTRAKGDLTIVAGNVPIYERLLKNEEDVGFAMEALGKYQQTFAACKEEAKYGEKLEFVQKVIEFGFHDIEVLIRLVQVAIDAIGR